MAMPLSDCNGRIPETAITFSPNPVDSSNSNPQFNNKSYNIGDLRVGVEGPTWEASIYVNNLTDELATYSHEWGIYEYGQGNLAEGRPNVASYG